MRFGSLFTGIGGIDLGLEWAGMTCAFQVELDPYCQHVLKKHWPDVPLYGDIREVDPDGLPPIDLLAGGFPCQPHSLAGRRRASADDRDLWGEYVRLIRGTRPRWVLAENVPGLLSSEAGRYFGKVLGDLADLGYDAEWQVLSAAGRGAPHLRRRVFLVAHAHGDALRQQPIRVAGRRGADVAGSDGPQEPLAHTQGERRGAWIVPVGDAAKEPEPGSLREAAGARESQPPRRLLEGWGRPGDTSWWRTEPALGRVAHGVPNRVDRLRTLGNAVVPEEAQHVGELIIEADGRMKEAPHG